MFNALGLTLYYTACQCAGLSFGGMELLSSFSSFLIQTRDDTQSHVNAGTVTECSVTEVCSHSLSQVKCTPL